MRVNLCACTCLQMPTKMSYFSFLLIIILHATCHDTCRHTWLHPCKCASLRSLSRTHLQTRLPARLHNIVMVYIAMAYIVMAPTTCPRTPRASTSPGALWTSTGHTCIVLAYIVMAYIVMAYIVMAYILMAYILMAHAVMACVGMAPEVLWTSTGHTYGRCPKLHMP